MMQGCRTLSSLGGPVVAELNTRNKLRSESQTGAERAAVLGGDWGWSVGCVYRIWVCDQIKKWSR